MFENLKTDLKNKMDKVLDVLHHEFASVRTGRANASLIEHIQVNAYDGTMPINQLGSISVQDRGTMLVVTPWDKKLTKEIEKAILQANIGVTPFSDAEAVKVPIPPLSEERRKELSKVVSQYAEHSKVSLRNVRRDIMDEVKHAEKEHQISEDELHRLSREVQKITDEYVEKIDALSKNKEHDIMSL